MPSRVLPCSSRSVQLSTRENKLRALEQLQASAWRKRPILMPRRPEIILTLHCAAIHNWRPGPWTRTAGHRPQRRSDVLGPHIADFEVFEPHDHLSAPVLSRKRARSCLRLSRALEPGDPYRTAPSRNTGGPASWNAIGSALSRPKLLQPGNGSGRIQPGPGCSGTTGQLRLRQQPPRPDPAPSK